TPTGTPIGDAAITYPLAATATSDANGQYSVDNITMIGSNVPRVDVATILHTGYWTESLLATVKPGQTTTFDVALVPKGTVTADAGAPVEGVQVMNSAGGGIATTDENGHYSFGNFRFSIGGGPTASVDVLFAPASPPGDDWATRKTTTLTDNQTTTLDAV